MKFKLVSNILVLRVSGVKIHRHRLDFTILCKMLSVNLHKIKITWFICWQNWGQISHSGLAILSHWRQGGEEQSSGAEIWIIPGLSPFSHTLCTHFRSLFALCAFTSARRNFQSKQFGMYPLQVSYNVGTDSRTIKNSNYFSELWLYHI